MPKCRQLSKLPKAKSIKSVNVCEFSSVGMYLPFIPVPPQFSRTTPGSLAFLLGWGHTGRHQRPRFVDTSHPATKLPKSAYKTFPNFRNEEIAIRAVPKALLTEAEIPWPDPPYHYGPPLSWSEQSERLRKAKEVNGVDGKVEQMKIDSVDMSMACVVGKKGVHKNATVRAKTTRRLKTAVSLVISRGAYTYVNRKGDNPNDIRLAFEDSANTDPYQWISPGALRALFLPTDVDSRFLTASDWTYVFTPTLSIYRMPYPELVGILRSAFAFMLKKIKRIEAQWIGADTSVLSSVKSPPARKVYSFFVPRAVVIDCRCRRITD